MSEEQIPAMVFPMTEYIADEMAERGWTTVDVVKRMEGQRDFMFRLMAFDILMVVYGSERTKSEVLVNDETFAGLARAFDVSEELFRNLDAVWKKHPDRRQHFLPPSAIWPDPPLYRLNVPDNDHLPAPYPLLHRPPLACGQALAEQAADGVGARQAATGAAPLIGNPQIQRGQIDGLKSDAN